MASTAFFKRNWYVVYLNKLPLRVSKLVLKTPVYNIDL